jgi:hypothetical protein
MTEHSPTGRAVEVLATAAAVVLMAAPADAQRKSPSPWAAQQPPATAAAAADGDFTSNGLKFHRVTPAGFTPTNYLVTEISTSNPAGGISVNNGGPPLIVAYAGYDNARILNAFTKHSSGGDSQPAEVATNVPPANKDSPATGTNVPLGFDPASKTVNLSSGGSVTYIDDQHAEVKLPGPAGLRTYELEYHKASAMGFAKIFAVNQTGGSGSSFSGTGVKISVPGANGMPGGELYDTAIGTNSRGQVEHIKPIIAAVTEANASAPENLRSSKVIKTLEANNLGLH